MGTKQKGNHCNSHKVEEEEGKSKAVLVEGKPSVVRIKQAKDDASAQRRVKKSIKIWKYGFYFFIRW